MIIKLNKGKETVIDDKCFDIIVDSGYKWKARLLDGHWYCQGEKRRYIGSKLSRNGRKIPGYRYYQRFLHRLLKEVIDPNLKVDHVDGDGLNNRLDNLRVATNSQNSMNSRKQLGCSSIYKGVCWDKKNNKWHSGITINKRQMNLGRFSSEIDAARAYDSAAMEYFGEFAKLNFP